jgi:hypothetical protein
VNRRLEDSLMTRGWSRGLEADGDVYILGMETIARNWDSVTNTESGDELSIDCCSI